MKVILRGGPSTHDGMEIDVSGGLFVIIPIEYKTPSYVGRKVCDKADCPDVGKHEYNVYRKFFNRKYEIVPKLEHPNIRSYEAHYRGEE